MKDDVAEYYTASATTFDHDWVDSILYEYSMEDPKATSQSTLFLVTIPSFIETNWYKLNTI